MEITRQIHESLQETEKTNDCGICGNDWIILWVDDCDLILTNDELIKIRMNRHSIFHKTALIQKRNYIQGNPKYIFR